MKNRILKAALFAAIVVAAGWNISQSEKEAKLSDIALENVEALTGGEKSELGDCLYNPWHYCCLLTSTGEICTPLHWAWY